MKKYGQMIPCAPCGETKPRREFHRSRLLSLSPVCKECANQASRAWRLKNPERVKRLNETYRARIKNSSCSYEDFPARIRCRKCLETKNGRDFYLSQLARRDWVCKSCHNQESAANKRRARRRAKGLPVLGPEKRERPQLPDWSSF